MQKDNRDENSVKVNYRFVLWKENTDTADALFHLARAVKCKGSFKNFYAKFPQFLEQNFETYKR